MSQAYVCRLCSNICIESESLCDTTGHYTEIYDITIRFFPPTFLGLNHGERNHFAVLCLECWHHISEFHNFQQAVLLVQAKLLKDAEQTRGVVQAQAEIRTQDCNIMLIQTAAVKEEDEFVSLSQADESNIEPDNHLIVTECALQFEAHADSLKDAILVDDILEDEDNVASNDEPDSFDEVFTEPVGVLIGGEFNAVGEKSEIQNDNISVPSTSTNCSKSKRKSIEKRKSVRQLDEAIAKWKPILKCEICSEPCLTFTLLQTHFREKHPNDTCYMVCCNRRFKIRYHIEQHIRIHLDPKTFKCPICNKCLTSTSILERHMYYVHGLERKNDLYSQDENNFPRKRAIRKHKCTICGKSYMAPSSLREHFTTHTGESIHNCSYCPKTFKYRSSLCHHMVKDHPENLNKTNPTEIISECSHCPKTFTYRTDLDDHVKVYHPEEFAKSRTNKM